MSHLHPEITDEEYHLVVDRLKPITAELAPDGVMEFDGETPDEWFARNVAACGEVEAVIRFKNKAKRQRQILGR